MARRLHVAPKEACGADRQKTLVSGNPPNRCIQETDCLLVSGRDMLESATAGTNAFSARAQAVAGGKRRARERVCSGSSAGWDAVWSRDAARGIIRR